MSPLEHTYDIASVELAFINHSLRVLNLGEIGMGIENLGPRVSSLPLHCFSSASSMILFYFCR
jgi:hypothetical protein